MYRATAQQSDNRASARIPGFVGGTKDYEKLVHKPQIEGVELRGDKELAEFGLRPLTADEILDLWR